MNSAEAADPRSQSHYTIQSSNLRVSLFSGVQGSYDMIIEVFSKRISTPKSPWNYGLKPVELRAEATHMEPAMSEPVTK